MTLLIPSPQFSATVDLSTVTVSYDLTTAPGSDAANVNLQMWLQRKDVPGQWLNIGPPIDTVLSIFPNGLVNKGQWKIVLPVGVYGAGKFDLFQSGTNFGNAVFEGGVSDMNFEVKTAQLRVTAPTLTLFPENMTVSATSVSLPYCVKLPKNWLTANAYTDGGFWAMIKGSGGFKQDWVPLNTDALKHNTDPLDDYDRVDGVFVAPAPTVSGIYNYNAGLFRNSWGTALVWLYPGVDFEIGDWVVACPPANYPKIADALLPVPGLPFALGGDYGNSVAWTSYPENDTPGFFGLLKANGLKVLRFNFNPNRFRDESLYRHVVQQIAENMLSAGVIPCLAPQEMPTGADPEGDLVKISQAMATLFLGKPVILDVLNEPHGYGTWAAWKPVAQRCCQAIRAIAPQAFITVGFENYSEDGRAANADPLPTGLVDLYGLHSYHNAPSELAAKAGTLPVALWEYHDTSEEFHAALASITSLKLIAAWAWTTKGQDQIALLDSVTGAVLSPNADGAAILGFYATWLQGKTLTAPPVPTPVVSPVVPVSGTPSGMTQDQIKAIADAEITAHLADLHTLIGTETGTSISVADAPMIDRLTALELRAGKAELRLAAIEPHLLTLDGRANRAEINVNNMFSFMTNTVWPLLVAIRKKVGV